VSAVQLSNGRSFVYALQGEKVQRREVRVGVDGEQWLEIVSGVKPEEEVVTAGLEGLSDGSTVRPARNVDPYGGTAASEVKQPRTRQE